MSNKGFTLIEVLVATIILFFSILTVNAAYKQYASYKLKQQKYENIYMSVLSLSNKIEASKISDILQNSQGTINGLKYSINVKKIASKRNYKYNFFNSKFGNYGRFLLSLYKIEIEMAGHKFILYKTGFQKML